MYIIAGLGNPGEEYAGTRHNAGRMLLERFAKRRGFSEWTFDKKLNALVTSGKMEGREVKLVLPETFMNKSGAALRPLVKNATQAERLVVIYDDLDLPLGVVRVALGRGSGGHRGLDSVIRSLRTRDFVRVRVGICPMTPGGKLKKPKGNAAVLDFILGTFSKREQDVFKNVSRRVNKVLAMLVEEGRATAMNRFN